MSESEYFMLQIFEGFETNSSSLLFTPDNIGALDIAVYGEY